MFVTDISITYDTAAADDIPVIFALAKDLIDTYEDIGSIDYDSVTGWVLNKISRNIADYRCIIVNGIKAGYYCLSQEVGQTELDDFYILPEFRGQGIGSAVLSHCIAQTATPLFLYVFKLNQKAIKLYSRMGFSVSEEVGNTRYIMRREVDRPTA